MACRCPASLLPPGDSRFQPVGPEPVVADLLRDGGRFSPLGWPICSETPADLIRKTHYRSSAIFCLADRLLGAQQDHELRHGEAWDYYFPYKISHGKKTDDSFTSFLRFSLARPRDIINMVMILQDNFVEKGKPSTEVFRQDDFDHVDFRRKYADYMLGEIKDYLSFYYASSDYELFLKFFEYLRGSPRFTYDEYLLAYSSFMTYVSSNRVKCPAFFESADTLLQFLYELSIICYVEETEVESFVRWCYRERSYANISPKVKAGLRYEIHYGLGKALNVGSRFRRHSV
jgi:hypothetical protein